MDLKNLKPLPFNPDKQPPSEWFALIKDYASSDVKLVARKTRELEAEINKLAETEGKKDKVYVVRTSPGLVVFVADSSFGDKVARLPTVMGANINKHVAGPLPEPKNPEI